MDKLTGAEFYTYILNVFKRTDKETETYEAITDMIMDMKLLFAFEDFKVEEYTQAIATIGDYKLSLPTNFQHLIGKIRCYDDNGVERILTKRTKETFDRLYPNPHASDVNTNVPQDFCIFSNQILLGDVPDSIDYYYEFSCSTEEGEEIVTGTTDVPFTDRYRKTLRQLVLGELYANLGYDEEAQKWKALGDQGLGAIMASETFNVDATESVDYQGV